NPFGDDECGKFYARAMAIWTILLACQGFRYDGPAGKIGFAPLWKPEDHVSFFTAAEGWGLFRQKRQEHRQNDTIDVKWGRLRLGVVRLALADGVRPDRVHVTLGGKSMATVHNMAGNGLTISLPPDTTIRAGEALEIVVET
ncbi:MAG TPA: glucosylceramidase, partial [Phycisphaerae bacterium]|nr:glucosylceramidase [Phycisphaerae bacterium]